MDDLSREGEPISTEKLLRADQNDVILSVIQRTHAAFRASVTSRKNVDAVAAEERERPA